MKMLTVVKWVIVFSLKQSILTRLVLHPLRDNLTNSDMYNVDGCLSNGRPFSYNRALLKPMPEVRDTVKSKQCTPCKGR